MTKIPNGLVKASATGGHATHKEPTQASAYSSSCPRFSQCSTSVVCLSANFVPAQTRAQPPSFRPCASRQDQNLESKRSLTIHRHIHTNHPSALNCSPRLPLMVVLPLISRPCCPLCLTPSQQTRTDTTTSRGEATTTTTAMSAQPTSIA